MWSTGCKITPLKNFQLAANIIVSLKKNLQLACSKVLCIDITCKDWNLRNKVSMPTPTEVTRQIQTVIQAGHTHLMRDNSNRPHPLI